MRVWTLCLIAFLAITLTVQAIEPKHKFSQIPHHFMNWEHHHYKQNLSNMTSRAKNPAIQTSYFYQPIDHFSNVKGVKSQKWSQRVLTDKTHWLGAKKLGTLPLCI